MDYESIIKDICDNTKIKSDDVFIYKDTPLENYCDQIFQFCQFSLEQEKGIGMFDIAPARMFYNNDRRINAWAWVNQGYSLISINIGTIHKLRSTFNECEDYFESDKNLILYKELNQYLKTLSTSVLYTMFDTSIVFLFFHEAGHLIQKSKKVYDFLSENPDKEESFNIYNHQIEVDADIFASINLTDYALTIWKNFADNMRTVENFYKLICVLMSGIGLNRLINLETRNKEIYFERHSHPHIIIRIIIIIEVMIDFLEHKLLNQELVDLKNINLDGILNSTFDLMEYLSPKLFNEDLFNDFSKIANEYSDEIEKYSKKLIGLVAQDKSMSYCKWKDTMEST